MKLQIEQSYVEATLKIIGDHAHLAAADEISTGIAEALNVFSEHHVDPLVCAAASGKLEKNELLSREEALLCVIWDMADDKAFRAVTLGWLFRAIDIRLSFG
ncbi:hypothetical protein SCT_0828 [Sulfuricella sp. T08]|uniref:hypothetical protein n=1 Tax=Sulfuricella sp. T08 TaxID=1632857 RepID=UPI0006179734|nr:hypothetical protein [Sulfuricella sp. T08]GAO35442.1 hypothetical protein SCT_0828 [Sulfuricella sp. T08]